jgi:hypothetical protein
MREDFYTKAIDTVLDHTQFTTIIDIRPVWKGEKFAEILKEKGGAYCDLRMGKGIDGAADTVSEFIIHIHEDLQSIVEPADFETGTNYRMQPFIESLGINTSAETVFLFALLHELGHLDVFEKFEKCGMIMEYTTLINCKPSSQKDRDSWINHNNIQIDQFINIIEAQSDIYAMTKFPKLWKLILEME